MRFARIVDLNVSRLCIGGNPFSGFSHQSPERDQEMRAFYTPERVKHGLRIAERAGINIFSAVRTITLSAFCVHTSKMAAQFSGSPRSLRTEMILAPGASGSKQRPKQARWPLTCTAALSISGSRIDNSNSWKKRWHE